MHICATLSRVHSRPVSAGYAPYCTCISPVAQGAWSRPPGQSYGRKPVLTPRPYQPRSLLTRVEALLPSLHQYQAQRQRTTVHLGPCFAYAVRPHAWHCLTLALRSSTTPTGAQQMEMHRLSVLVFWWRRPSASPFRPLPRPGVPWRPYSLLLVPHPNTACANLLNSPKNWQTRLPYRLMSGSLFPQMEAPHGGLR